MDNTNTTLHPPPSSDSGWLGVRKGSARLFKVTDGLLELAEVAVECTPAHVATVAASVIPEPGEYPSPADWVAAAVRGAERGLAALERNWPGRGNGRVVVKQIRGTVSDTRPIAVEVAAAVAVWRSGADHNAEPTIVWGRDLRVTFPFVPVMA